MLNIPAEGALDFLALGAMVHRVDPGRIPFHKANQCAIHVSGGEFNCAANLADCFGMNTGIATAMVNNPIGELILYQTEDGRTRIECRFADETLWLSQALMAELSDAFIALPGGAAR